MYWSLSKTTKLNLFVHFTQRSVSISILFYFLSLPLSLSLFLSLSLSLSLSLYLSFSLYLFCCPLLRIYGHFVYFSYNMYIFTLAPQSKYTQIFFFKLQIKETVTFNLFASVMSNEQKKIKSDNFIGKISLIL